MRAVAGSVVKTLWTSTDELFCLWLGLFRDHLTTILLLAGLLPLAIWTNSALGSVLAIHAVILAAAVSTTMRHTETGQRRAEDGHTALACQVGDVLGNAPPIIDL